MAPTPSDPEFAFGDQEVARGVHRIFVVALAAEVMGTRKFAGGGAIQTIGPGSRVTSWTSPTLPSICASTSTCVAGMPPSQLISLDDAFTPPKAVEQTRKLVEQEEVLLIFNSNGTAANSAVQKYLNARKVPQLFVSSGASKFSDPKNFHWTMGWLPTYYGEARIYAHYILKHHPNAKIGVLYQNDDFGKDPTDPQWDNDPAMRAWVAFMKKYYPDGDLTDWYNVYAYVAAQTLVQVFKQCADDLSRENVMRQAASLRNFELPLLLPGIRINTSPADYRVIRQAQLQRFDGGLPRLIVRRCFVLRRLIGRNRCREKPFDAHLQNLYRRVLTRQITPRRIGSIFHAPTALFVCGGGGCHGLRIFR